VLELGFLRHSARVGEKDPALSTPFLKEKNGVLRFEENQGERINFLLGVVLKSFELDEEPPGGRSIG